MNILFRISNKMSWTRMILAMVLFVEYVDAKGSGLLNDYSQSRESIDPEVMWTMDPVNHDTQRTSTTKYAELRNVEFLSSGNLGWDFYSNYRKNGLLSFSGTSESLVYIDNSDNILNGGKGMTWIFEIRPSNSGVTTTILKYQKVSGQITFHLKLLSDNRLSCCMTDTSGKIHDFTSSFNIPSDIALFGVTFNYLWTDEHFRFVLYDASQANVESHSLGPVEMQLDLIDSTDVTVGASFLGRMSCIMFHPLAFFLNALDEQPQYCDPQLSSNLVDHTLSLTVITTEESSTSADQTTENILTTTILPETTVQPPTSAGVFRVEENCSTFAKVADDRCLSVPESVNTVSSISSCAEICSSSGNCDCFSTSGVGNVIECSTATPVSSMATSYQAGCTIYCL